MCSSPPSCEDDEDGEDSEDDEDNEDKDGVAAHHQLEHSLVLHHVGLLLFDQDDNQVNLK